MPLAHSSIEKNVVAAPPERGAIGPYRLRGLLYARAGQDEDAWRATLLCDRRRVARLHARRRCGPIAIDFLCPRDQLHAQAFAVQRKFCTEAPTETEAIESALQDLLLELAEHAYHLRQLQVQSRKHTLFRLAGDPLDHFHSLRNAPYSAFREGQLRLVYGQRLVEIVRPGDCSQTAGPRAGRLA